MEPPGVTEIFASVGLIRRKFGHSHSWDIIERRMSKYQWQGDSLGQPKEKINQMKNIKDVIKTTGQEKCHV